MTRRLSCTILTRVSQVASPRKSAKMRMERVQKINKVSRSLFGPIIKSEFRSYAQMEMAKYQLKAANKWSFDFANESPISNENCQYQWESVRLPSVPKFYHHIVNANKLQTCSSSGDNESNAMFDECENICPLTRNFHGSSSASSTLKSRQKSVSPPSTRAVCFSQTKITDYLKIRKRRLSTASAVCIKKARADF